MNLVLFSVQMLLIYLHLCLIEMFYLKLHSSTIVKAYKSIIPKQSETSPLFPDKLHDMVPHSGTEGGGARNPKLRAAPERNSVVVEHRWYDHSPIKDGTDQKRVS